MKFTNSISSTAPTTASTPVSSTGSNPAPSADLEARAIESLRVLDIQGRDDITDKARQLVDFSAQHGKDGVLRALQVLGVD